MTDPKDREVFVTGSGSPVEACYGPSPEPPVLGDPGEFPFTRGVHPTM